MNIFTSKSLRAAIALPLSLVLTLSGALVGFSSGVFEPEQAHAATEVTEPGLQGEVDEGVVDSNKKTEDNKQSEGTAEDESSGGALPGDPQGQSELTILESQAVVTTEDELSVEDTSQNGWVSEIVEGVTYWYYYVDGAPVSDDWHKIGGLWYHFGSTGVMDTGVFRDSDYEYYYLGPDGAMKTNCWSQNADGWRYHKEDGHHKKEWHFDKGFWYYLDRFDGVMYEDIRKLIGGKYYRLLADGKMAIGWYQFGAEGKDWNYYHKDGSEATGMVDIEGSTYYFSANFDNIMYKGYVIIGASGYQFDKNGKMVHGWYGIDGSYCYYDLDTGAEASGWLFDKGSWYYLNPDNGNLMVRGYKEINGVGYEFDSSGKMQAPFWKEDEDGWRYYYSEQGPSYSGWLTLQGKRYYLDPNNSNRMARNYTEIGDKAYHFHRQTGEMIYGWVEYDRGWRFYDLKTGAGCSGWLQDGGAWYFLDSRNFNYMAASTRLGLDGKIYGFSQTGQMQTGWAKTYDGVDVDKWRYYEPNGAEKSGWLLDKGSWYYLDPDYMNAMATGYMQIAGVGYDFDSSGKMQAPFWREDEDGWRYYYSEQGPSYSGWLTLQSKRYYLDPNNSNRMAASQRLSIDGRTYGFSQTGQMQTGWTKVYDGTSADLWRYYEPNGAEKSGWLLDKGSWYYLDPYNMNAMATGPNVYAPWEGGKSNYSNFASTGQWLDWAPEPE